MTLQNLLNQWFAITRYPKEKEITEHMAQTAIKQAQEVYVFCLAKIQPEKTE